MTRRLRREILAMIELREMFGFEPLTTEAIAQRLEQRGQDVKHIVWGLWMDGKIRAVQAARGAKRRWVRVP